MKLLCALVVLCVVGVVSAEFSPVRMIQLEGGEVRKMHTREAWKLRKEGVRFIDVTESGVFAEDVEEKYYGIPTSCTQQTIVEPLLAQISQNRMWEFDMQYSSHYNRFFNTPSGKRAAEWLHDKYLDGILRSGRKDVHVRYFNNTFLQPSVIVTFDGNGTNKDEFVIIGAHLDSVNWEAENPELGRSPGSNDDGSGTTTIHHAFELLIESGYVPSRTLEFHCYAAEEVGLLGSAPIAAQYAANGVKVAAMVEMDEVGFATTYEPPRVKLITDETSPILNSFLAEVVDTYLVLDVYNDTCGYGCSDFYTWSKVGYQASFPTEGGELFGQFNTWRHTARDSVDKMSFTFMVEFVKLALGYVVELSMYVEPSSLA